MKILSRKYEMVYTEEELREAHPELSDQAVTIILNEIAKGMGNGDFFSAAYEMLEHKLEFLVELILNTDGGQDALEPVDDYTEMLLGKD